MENNETPADRLHAQLEQAIGTDRTSYAAGKQWAIAANCPQKRTIDLVLNWRKSLPLSVGLLAEFMDSIGYKLTIIRKKN